MRLDRFLKGKDLDGWEVYKEKVLKWEVSKGKFDQ